MLPSLLSMLLNSNQDYIEYFESNIRWFLGQVGSGCGREWIEHYCKHLDLKLLPDSDRVEFVRRRDKTRQVKPGL